MVCFMSHSVLRRSLALSTKSHNVDLLSAKQVVCAGPCPTTEVLTSPNLSFPNAAQLLPDGPEPQANAEESKWLQKSM